MTRRKIKLGFSARGLGYHATAWRDPDVPADGGTSLQFYVDMARTAERGMFDMVFLADSLAMSMNDVPKGSLGRTSTGADLEPLTLVAALTQTTRNIGFVATASTTFQHPYHIARLFSSLDHLSGGRVGWNVVTSAEDSAACKFGFDSIAGKAERYERAREAVQVVFGLWDSWEDDAFVRDKSSGVFFDVKKMHPINHAGKFFKVSGPLDVARTPQGRPIVVQAGSSNDGMELAAATADVVYTAQDNLADATAFYARLKGRLQTYGRTEDEMLVMPGILPVVGESRGDAQKKYERMEQEIDALVGLQQLSLFFGDLSGYPLDGPVPDLNRDNGTLSRGELLLKLARRNNWSIRRLYQSKAVGQGHLVAIGSPIEIVDQMEEWLSAGAADGFNVLPAKSPAGINEFVDKIVPELQRRGLLRTEYESKTLRGLLGLRPSKPTWSMGEDQKDPFP
jgi:N-acetyl-S-(2-succino)cysteine monooxygenase